MLNENELTDEEIKELYYSWELWARKEQLIDIETQPEVLPIIAGRGFGKTRTGAEWVRKLAETAYTERIALIAPTMGDAIDVMIEGESGIMSISHPDFYPEHNKNRKTLTWPNGVKAKYFSAQKPDRLRGPQHGAAWCDELAAWQYWETYEQMEFGLRLGKRPLVCITTTPKPRKEFVQLVKEHESAIITGSTFDNAENLPQSFLNKLRRKYEGTRLGQQELYASLIGEVKGALWRRQWLEDYRVNRCPELSIIAIGLDPAVKDDPTSDDTGIILAGIGANDGRYYVFADETINDTTKNWAEKTINLYKTEKANSIIAEVNNGGDLVTNALYNIDSLAIINKVWASKGKKTRAEPISMLYEQGKVSHVGYLAALEDELCTWDPADKNARSPNRLDALVWVLTYLHERNAVNEAENEPVILGTLTSAEI